MLKNKFLRKCNFGQMQIVASVILENKFAEKLVFASARLEKCTFGLI